MSTVWNNSVIFPPKRFRENRDTRDRVCRQSGRLRTSKPKRGVHDPPLFTIVHDEGKRRTRFLKKITQDFSLPSLSEVFLFVLFLFDAFLDKSAFFLVELKKQMSAQVTWGGRYVL